MEADAKRSRKANWSLDEIHLLLQQLLVEGGALFSAVTPSFAAKMKKAADVVLNLVRWIDDVLSSKSKFGIQFHIVEFLEGMTSVTKYTISFNGLPTATPVHKQCRHH